jgi:hypothetical protein
MAMLLVELEALIRLGAELSGCEFIDATIYRHSYRCRQTFCISGLSIWSAGRRADNMG